MAQLTHIEGGSANETQIDRVQFSAAATIGPVVADSNGQWAESDAATQAGAGQYGVGLLMEPVHAADGWGNVIRSGKAFVDTATVGEVYAIDGGVSGDVVAHSALVSTDWVTTLYVGKVASGSTVEVVVNPTVSNAQKP